MLVYVKTWSVRCTIWNHIAVVSVVLVWVFLWIMQQEELMGQHPSGVTRTSYLGSSSPGIRVIRVRVIRVLLYITSRVWSVNSLLDMSTDSPPPPPPFHPHLKLMLITLRLIKHYLKFTYQESASQSLIPALKKKTAKTDLTFVDNSHSQ